MGVRKKIDVCQQCFQFKEKTQVFKGKIVCVKCKKEMIEEEKRKAFTARDAEYRKALRLHKGIR